MKNILLYTLIFIGGIGLVRAQDVPPTHVLENYTLNAGGSASYIATQSITLKPNTWIKAGSTFSAKIVSDAYITPSLSSNENYVFTRSFQKGMTSTSGIIENKDVIEQVTYFDGLGRAMQQIAIKATPGKKDIITHIDYDAFGRQALEYLPYGTGQNKGQYNASALSQTHNFYNAAKYENTTNPYSEKVYEASPLNRVLEIGAPGASWKANPSSDADHTIKFEYATNGSNEVRNYGVSLSSTYVPTLTNSPAYYAANTLYVSVTKDENWKPEHGNNHTTREYKDKQGRVVLKRTYNNTAHDTYYVYDDYGNLTYVLSPKVNTADGVNATELKELCYQYRYDNRNRLIEKQLPGKGREYIVYNKLDQPIMTQDANQKSKSEWLFTKYDAFGRVVYTGKDTGNGNTREALQSSANSTVPQFESKSSTATSYAGTPVYYSKVAYPTSFDQVLTINYYDNYTFDKDGLSVPTSVLGQPVDTRTQSLATGSKVRVLETNNWITSLYAYDKQGRVIYTATKNAYLSTTTIVEHKLDFGGKVLETKTTHSKGSNAALVTVDSYEYDHMGRQTRQMQKIGSGASELIAANSYDVLGQLETKKVGNTESKPLQTISYAYNVRGWLKAINDADNLGSKLFGFELSYNSSKSGASSPLYNGNISETYWKTKSDNVLRRYAYSYDALNRITKGVFNASGQTDRYTLGSIAYDKNGNITSLIRNGHINEAGTSFGTLSNPMDKLAYSYHDGGNFLVKVSDAGNKSYGFVDGANTDNDYGRDANGDMIRDKNKGITAIAYNHLNLPTKVTTSQGNIEYFYGADGVKLKKRVSNGATTDYAGGYIYENGALQFFNHAEGYVAAEGAGYKYVYQYKDHLGNVRLSYSDADLNGSINPSTEILQERNYYPFGLEHRGYNSNIIGVENNRWTYQGQELTKDLGLNVHEWKYRISDPAIGRFWQIDPLAEDYYHNGTYNFSENRVIDAWELEGLEARVIVEEGNYAKANVGHTFVSVGSGKNQTVYTYGRWAGTDASSGSSHSPLNNGPGVMVKLTGDEARAEINKYVNDYGAQVFELANVDESQVQSNLESEFNKSTETPDQGKYEGDNRAHVIDNYELTSCNCTTKSLDAVESGNGNKPVSYKTTVSSPKLSGGKATVNMNVMSISPADLSKQLNAATKDSKSGVIDVTNTYKKDDE